MGWKFLSAPDEQFLKEWREKFSIPFEVAASPRDPGFKFYTAPSIPNVVVIDQEQKLSFKKIKASIDEWFEHITRISE